MEQIEPLNPTRLVGERVAQIRSARGMTQEALAEAMREAGVEMERVVIAKLEKGLRPFIKLDELLGLCLVLSVAPIDMLLPADLDGSQPYALTPTATTSVGTARDWFRGETAIMRPHRGPLTGLYGAKGRPTAAEIAAFIQWMPDDRGREVMLRWLEEQKQWEEERENRLLEAEKEWQEERENRLPDDRGREAILRLLEAEKERQEERDQE